MAQHRHDSLCAPAALHLHPHITLSLCQGSCSCGWRLCAKQRRLRLSERLVQQCCCNSAAAYPISTSGSVAPSWLEVHLVQCLSSPASLALWCVPLDDMLGSKGKADNSRHTAELCLMGKAEMCAIYLSVVWCYKDEAQRKSLLRCTIVPVPHVLHSTGPVSMCFYKAAG